MDEYIYKFDSFDHIGERVRGEFTKKRRMFNLQTREISDDSLIVPVEGVFELVEGDMPVIVTDDGIKYSVIFISKMELVEDEE